MTAETSGVIQRMIYTYFVTYEFYVIPTISKSPILWQLKICHQWTLKALNCLHVSR